MKEYFRTKNGVLYHGDCLEVLPELGEDCCDLIITSPPYNIKSDLHGKNKKGKYGDEYIDSLSQEEYFDFQNKFIGLALKSCKNYIFYNIQMVSGNKKALFKLIGSFSDYIKEVLIWDKIHIGPAVTECTFTSLFEFIFILSKDDNNLRMFNHCNFIRGSFDNILRLKGNISRHLNEVTEKNNASFPVELPTILLKSFSKSNYVILDPFMGIGTTAIACENLGLKWIGIELSENFCELTANNLSDNSYRDINIKYKVKFKYESRRKKKRLM